MYTLFAEGSETKGLEGRLQFQLHGNVMGFCMGPNCSADSLERIWFLTEMLPDVVPEGAATGMPAEATGSEMPAGIAERKESGADGAVMAAGEEIVLVPELAALRASRIWFSFEEGRYIMILLRLCFMFSKSLRMMPKPV